MVRSVVVARTVYGIAYASTDTGGVAAIASVLLSMRSNVTGETITVIRCHPIR